MTCFITLVRHGQSVCNAAGIMQCTTGGELTDRGKKMATSLGQHLRSETFTRVYCSDLHRCVQTTKFILEQLHTKLPNIVYTPSLRERDYGDWELKPLDFKPIRDKIAEMNLAPHEYHTIEVPNGESYMETRKRAERFLCEIEEVVDGATENQPENILVVSHGIFLLCFLENIVQNPSVYDLVNFDAERLKEDPENCSRTRFSMSKPHVGAGNRRTVVFTHFFDIDHFHYLSED